MTEMFRCGDNSALVAYLYDECEPETRAAIAAHVAACVGCASELDGLAGTRQVLASWTPPEARLGFLITRDAAEAGVSARGDRAGLVAAFGGPRPESTGWWRQPLPAWAQAAAAALIFASGLAIGATRIGPAPSQTAARQAPSVTGMEQTLAALERRVADVEGRSQRPVAVQVADVPGPFVSERRLREEIDAFRAEQDAKLATRTLLLMAETNQKQRRFGEEIQTNVRQEVEGLYQRVSLAAPR